jgi:hypothetical protein
VVFHASVANVHTVLVKGQARKFDHRPLTAAPAAVAKAAEMGQRVMSAAGILAGRTAA